jgi:excinuclease ABC subunit B
MREDADTEQLLGGGGRQQSRGKSPVPGLSSRARARTAGGVQAGPGSPAGDAAADQSEARRDLVELIGQLTEQMHTAAAELQFEIAARLRDEIRELKHELRGMQAAGV